MSTAGYIIVQVIIALLVMPKLYNLYSVLNQTPPVDLPYIVIASIIIGLAFIVFLATSEPLNKIEVEKLKQDKEELITINSSLVNKKFMLLFWVYAGLSSVALAAAIILPISGLASSVQ